MNKAFEDGCWAAFAGLRREDNPYSDPVHRNAWDRGYDGTKEGLEVSKLVEDDEERQSATGWHAQIPLAAVIVIALAAVLIVELVCELLSGGGQ